MQTKIKEINRLLKVVGVFAIVAATVYLLMPRENRREIGEPILRFIGNKSQICFDYTREKLIDPSSAEFVEFISVEDNVFDLTLRAKTAGGLTKVLTQRCVVRDGKVNDFDSNNEEKIRKYKLDEICMKANIKYLEIRNAHLFNKKSFKDAEALALSEAPSAPSYCPPYGS